MGVAVLKELPSIENGTKGLVQSYINALHVDNHMYDVGVYFVITSVHPLRLYVFDEWLVRVCKKRFPTTIEDFDDAESFVIRDYQPLWNMESVGPIHRQLKHNRKALLKYLDSKVKGASGGGGSAVCVQCAVRGQHTVLQCGLCVHGR
mmetsp:Transcript_30564/g.66139  ORF Transcript_30564/g.66139 Transcript_30564/m.66139 type:complete len:148 (-) Transcript_30564:165-608(-)